MVRGWDFGDVVAAQSPRHYGLLPVHHSASGALLWHIAAQALYHIGNKILSRVGLPDENFLTGEGVRDFLRMPQCASCAGLPRFALHPEADSFSLLTPRRLSSTAPEGACAPSGAVALRLFRESPSAAHWPRQATVARVFTASIFMLACPSSRASARRPAATPHCGIQNQ